MMPEIFSSDDDFNQWFSFGTGETQAKKGGKIKKSEDEDDDVMKDDAENEAENSKNIELIESLHKIMRPFLLRRTKADLATKLPDKIEIIVNTSLSPMQYDIYEKLLKSQNIFSDKSKNGRQLNNLLMQLRKACNHPYIFDGVEPDGAEEYGEHLVENCGKFKFMDRLLKKIAEKKEQVLLFTNFTSLLDILEDYCAMRGFKFCRLDGSTELEERDRCIREFTEPGSDIFLFMLSTRAGGLGINLMTANHVILYDSDWNPQVDL
jgi:SWI/SNF-related matrix-associated actin-dependent regulator of chromatin subfamily A member 5